MIDNKVIKENIALSFQKCLATDDGKVVLERLSKLCNEHEASYVDQNFSGTAYKEGQRSVILHIRKMLNKNINEVKQKEAL